MHSSERQLRALLAEDTDSAVDRYIFTQCANPDVVQIPGGVVSPVRPGSPHALPDNFDQAGAPPDETIGKNDHARSFGQHCCQ